MSTDRQDASYNDSFSKPYFAYFASVGVIGIIFVTIWGFWNHDWGEWQAWRPAELNSVLFTLSLPALMLLVGSFTRIWTQLACAATICVLLLTYGPAVLAVLILHFFGAVAIGRLLFRIELHTIEDIILSFVLGFGVLGVFVGYFGGVRIHFDFVYSGLLLLAIIAERRAIMRAMRDIASPGDRSKLDNQNDETVRKLSLCIPILLALALMLYASSPESGFDALVTHFALFNELQHSGEFHFDPTVSPFVLMPKTTVWGLSVSGLLGGEFALRAMHASLVLLVGALIYIRIEKVMGAASAALLIATLLSAPAVLWISSQFFEESGTLLFVTAAAIFLLRGADRPSSKTEDWLALACLGMAVSSKIQALFFGLLGVTIVFRRLVDDGINLNAVKSIGIGCAIFMVTAAGPYLRAYLVTGNPFHPFRPGTTVDARWEHPIGFKTPFDISFETPLHMEAWPGGFAFQYPTLLIAGILALFLFRFRSISSLAAITLVFTGTLLSQTAYARYQLYAFPLLMICFAYVYARLPKLVAYTTSAFLLLVTALNFAHWQSVHVPTFQVRQLIDPSFSTELPIERRVFSAINELHGDSAVTLIGGQYPYTGGLHGTVHSLSPTANAINTEEDLTDLATKVLEADISHVVIANQPRNLKVLEFCELACLEYPQFSQAVRYFKVDRNRASKVADGSLEKPPEPESYNNRKLVNVEAVNGWNKESWGWWSVGDESSIQIQAPQDGVNKIALTIKPFTPPGTPGNTVTVFVNNTQHAIWEFTPTEVGANRVFEVEFPQPVGLDGAVDLRFEYERTYTPQETMGTADTRQLAMGLVELQILDAP